MLGESSWHARGKRGREKEGVLVSSRMRRGKVRRGRRRSVVERMRKVLLLMLMLREMKRRQRRVGDDAWTRRARNELRLR
jgi:hypothetical protein